MENLEKIDTIRERLGVSYEKANQALQEANGDIVAALIKLEKEQKDSGKDTRTDFIHVKGQELVGKIREIVKEGNANKIVVKNNEKTLAEIPVTAGVVSLAIFPYLTLLAGAAAMYKDYTLEIDKENKNTNTNKENKEQ